MAGWVDEMAEWSQLMRRARRDWEELLDFAEGALALYHAPRQRWELGAVTKENVRWRCPKPTAKCLRPGQIGWYEEAARRILAGEWTHEDAYGAYMAGESLCL